MDVAGTGSVTSSDGTRIGYVTVGSGPPLLLVHGGMTSSRRWAPLLAELSRRYTLTAMDRRGRGMSPDGAAPGPHSLALEYDDVAVLAGRLAEEQGGAPVDVLGHSYGAVCALGAASRGAALRRLVLYEPPGPATVPGPWVERVRTLLARGEPGRAMVSFLVEVVGLTYEQVEALRDRQDGGLDDILSVVSATLLREAHALAGVDLRALAAAVAQPVLLLLGELSPPWAGAVTRELASALPDARVAPLHGQGHEAVDADPALVAAQLDRFLGAEPWPGTDALPGADAFPGADATAPDVAPPPVARGGRTPA
jgi:pimeloyl-ACP methyl ester carboxylesterase